TVERISQVHFHKVTNPHTKQWPRNMPFKTPGIVINHARSDFALSFANSPVPHFAALFPTPNRDGNVRGECPTPIFAEKMGLRLEHKLSLTLFLRFILLTIE